MKSLGHEWLFATPWTVAYQPPLSMGFSRQEYWSGLPFPSPGDLCNPGIEPESPTLQADRRFTVWATREARCLVDVCIFRPRVMAQRASLVAQTVKNCPQCRRPRFSPWGQKIPWRGNGNPLQYSCLENSKDRGARQAPEESDTTEQLPPPVAQRNGIQGVAFNLYKHSCLSKV